MYPDHVWTPAAISSSPHPPFDSQQEGFALAQRNLGGSRVLNKNPLKNLLSLDAIDWKDKEKSVLVLCYTMSCPLACDFCCYDCHPGRKEKMPLDLALKLVEQVADLSPSIFSSVCFTGGEAMLFLDEILVIGSVLHKHALPFTIATACHWAETPAKAGEIIDMLADRGLSRLNISYDSSHSKFVPTEFVYNAVYAANRREIETFVVGTFYTVSESVRDQLPELLDLPHVRLMDKRVAKVGRASKKNITQEKYGLDLGIQDFSCYRAVYHDIAVFYDGAVYPCCSTFNRATPGLIIGNALNDSLLEIWERCEGSLMLRILKRQGFGRFYEVIKAFDPDLYEQLPSPKLAVGPCSLCNAIFGNLEWTVRIHEIFSKHEQEQVTEVLDTMLLLLGEDKTRHILEDILHPS